MVANKVKTHTRYYNSLGEQIAGVTSIIGVLDKPSLVAWANRMGLQGIDSTKYKDKLADVGSITHLKILHHLKHTTPDLSEYAPADIELSENCMLSFYEWEKTHKLEPIALETPWVSARYNYGGTEDFLGYINGRLEIMDFKTGGIYLSAILQAAALRQLAQELGHPVEHARILSIPRANNESFREELLTRFDDEFEIFKNCLSIYNLLKKTGRRL